MDREATLALLAARGISCELIEHEAVFHMGVLTETEVPHLKRIAKTLLLRDDKKSSYYLVSVMGEKRLDLKSFRRAHATRPLSFATADELARLLALTPGSVTPLALLACRELPIPWFVDKAFDDECALIGVHPNDNTATVFLDVNDLITLLRDCGVTAEFF